MTCTFNEHHPHYNHAYGNRLAYAERPYRRARIAAQIFNAEADDRVADQVYAGDKPGPAPRPAPQPHERREQEKQRRRLEVFPSDLETVKAIGAKLVE